MAWRMESSRFVFKIVWVRSCHPLDYNGRTSPNIFLGAWSELFLKAGWQVMISLSVWMIILSLVYIYRWLITTSTYFIGARAFSNLRRKLVNSSIHMVESLWILFVSHATMDDKKNRDEEYSSLKVKMIVFIWMRKRSIHFAAFWVIGLSYWNEVYTKQQVGVWSFSETIVQIGVTNGVGVFWWLASLIDLLEF